MYDASYRLIPGRSGCDGANGMVGRCTTVHSPGYKLCLHSINQSSINHIVSTIVSSRTRQGSPMQMRGQLQRALKARYRQVLYTKIKTKLQSLFKKHTPTAGRGSSAAPGCSRRQVPHPAPSAPAVGSTAGRPPAAQRKTDARCERSYSFDVRRVDEEGLSMD